MGTQNYGTVRSRNLIRASQGMLKHAANITVLGDFGTHKEHPEKSTDTQVFRRCLPFGAVANGTTIEGTARYAGTPNIDAGNFILAEGSTPAPNTISYQDVSVTLQEYGVLFKLTSKAELMYEDNITEDMVQQTGEVMGEISEMVDYGVLKAGSTVIYANGSSRSAVNTKISLPAIRKAIRTMAANRAKPVTSRISSTVNFGSTPIKPSYLVFVHTDAMADCQDLPKFKNVEDYGSFKPVHEHEFGSCEGLRFIASPLLEPFLAAGSGTLNGCLSVGGANVDIYPFIVVGQDAWGKVSLKGKKAVSPTIILPGQKNHANPLGQFGYVGGSMWIATVRLNDAWMARIECGVSDLSL